MVGLRIKRYHKENGISQRWLANRIGAAPETVGAILSGRHKCRFDTYVKICAALGVPLNRFAPPGQDAG